MSMFLATLLVLGSLLFSGCMASAQWQLRTFYGLDCRPEKLTPDGRCVPVKGEGHAQTAQP
jgi:hypothetical protein